MREKFSKVRGRIEFFRVSDGIWTKLFEQHNMITYGGSDTLAKAISNQAHLNAVYMVFENNPAAVRITEAKDNDAATYAAASVDRSFVRVSTLGEPVLQSSGTDYVNNEVVFLAVSDGTTEFPAVPVTDGTSVFYHTALVCAPDMTDQTLDVVFSCSDLTSDITKVAGAQIGIRWTITFETP